MGSQMPWESLKAETMRAIHRDLGLPYQGRRDEMIERLREIEVNGLEAASEKEESEPESLPPRVRRKSSRALAADEPSPRRPSSSPQRKSVRGSAASVEVNIPATRKRRAARAVFDGIDVPATRLLKRRSLGGGADGVAIRGTKRGGRGRRGKGRS
ncbi:hypothetical protein OBBRIDRAFT_798226 [Obba rivulosa]|uniref:SAP domain-containing protein n=1 Tax=Obba rivulosa TaxID=1052685 RepID=A0A8E2ANS7_9APHY|nr:hypothetical protein OBBRIDRAFT_798226 [Obba rivulosa]